MISGKNTRKSNSLDAELDALVAREVDALALRQVRAGTKTRPPREDEAKASAAHETEGETLQIPTPRSRDGASRPASSISSADNVIGIRHGGLPGETDVLAFSADEEAFIEQAVAFLRERPNADVILEEMWHHTVRDRDDGDTEQKLDNEIQMVDESTAPDHREEPVLPADPETLEGDDKRVTALQPSMTKTRARNGTAAETAPAESTQPASPRGQQKREGGERE